MSWQKLKNKFLAGTDALAARINLVVGYLAVPLNLFRVLVILLAIDFIAFMALTRSSYLQMLNPAHFLWADPGESRDVMELWFPRSLSLTGLEKIYPEDEAPAAGKNEKPGPAQEKPLDDAAIASEAIMIRKRVSAPLAKMPGLELSKDEAMARRVMLELMAGPSGEMETLKARNLLKEPLFLRSIWTHNSTIYISTEKSVWDKLGGNERKITEYCITESLKKSLPGAKFALLKE